MSDPRLVSGTPRLDLALSVFRMFVGAVVVVGVLWLTFGNVL